MTQLLGVHPLRKRRYRTLSLLCDDEALSDIQLKAYHSRLQEYQTFIDAVSRLALCGNVCITEEAVTIGDHGLLTGESLNALQHAGAISVYNTLQQNNWEFPVAEEGEVAVIKAHNPIPDEFLDSEKPIRSDWPAVHISECFVEGDRAKLHGSVRPLRTFLPPTVVFRNAADIDEDIPEPELNIPNDGGLDCGVELVSSAKGITVKRKEKNGREEYIPIDQYYFDRQDGAKDYYEEKGDFRFKCAVCQRIFYSNIKLMSHILGHVDETSQAGLNIVDVNQCQLCGLEVTTAFDLRAHMEQEHPGVYLETQPLTNATSSESLVSQTASQLQQRVEILGSEVPNSGETVVTVGALACRICGKEANSELALAHHLQSTHREREMPYVCRLCLFRSSLYEDILDHFKKEHDNSNHLLCTYCLRIFTPSDARTTPYSCMVTAAGMHVLGSGIGQTQVYLQHLRMHQIRHQLRRCPTCKLNFTNKSDYQVHRRLDHRAMRGTSVDKSTDVYAESGVVTMEEATDKAVQHLKDTQPHITLMNAPEAGQLKSLDFLHLPENIAEHVCLECNQSFGNSDHSQYLPCSKCRFGTCCPMGYNRHMSRVHVYMSGRHQAEPDIGMPLLRPIYFQWMSGEVNAKEDFDQQLGDPGEQGASITQGTPEESIRNLLPANEVPIAHSTVSQSEQNAMEVDQSDNSQPVSETQTQAQTANSGVVGQDDPDITDLLATGEELTAAEKLTSDSAGIEALTTLTPLSGSHSSSTQEAAKPVTLTEAPPSIVSGDLKRLQVVIKYMASQLDARQFACTHCAISNLNGNSLARHLVEECGTDTVTLNPNPSLVKARLEAEEQYRLQQEIRRNEQNETGILFEATDSSLPGQVTMTEGATPSDVIMVAMGADQLASYGAIDPTDTDRALLNNELVTQAGPTGTTIDVTNADGEVVQQFIIPDDLQLEQGQTLVVIHGEDGQPQLAIMNQADLIGAEDSRLLQSEEDDANSMLLYTQGHPTHGMGEVKRNEEKENHRFAM